MITALNNVALQINIEVKFKLRSLTDKQTWRGRVIGISGYDVAEQYNEVNATHNNMEPEVARREIVSMTFIILKCADGHIRPFAVDWIIEPTFERTDNVTDMHLIVHNVSENEQARIMTYIRNLGYEVSEVV